MTLLLAYAAGLLTLLNPCVLPVLPLVLASALSSHRFGPVALAAGMSVTFVVLGLALASAGQVLGLDEDAFARIGALALVGFGAILMVPRLSAGFASATGGLAARADGALPASPAGLWGQGLAGAGLGAVWSPCIGPTLGAALALAAQGASLAQAGAVMIAFALGVSSFMLVLAYGARAWIARNRAAMMRLATRTRPLMGALFLATGLALWFGLHHRAEAALIGLLPDWFLDFSISI